MKRKQYTAEYRHEAVKLVKESGLSVQRAATDLGMSKTVLWRWVKQAAVDDGQRPGLTTAEREELHRLQRENRQLRMEREILKKAAAFFANERR